MEYVMMVDSMKKRRNTDELTTLHGPNPAATDALEALYDGYYDRIYAYCVHRLFCRTVAEDVTSQIFLAAARGIGSVSSNELEVHLRWLYGIATNQCNSYIRQHLRRRKIFEKFQHEQSHHQSTIDLPPDWTAVYGAIAQLKEIEQTVITLRFFENMGYDQISAIINKRQTSVRVILHRALKKLQKLLNPADCGFMNRGVGHE
jgi:RNA polymerase sigma-70 factor (ECF subfamily)